jgi:bifunctional UDP-N-acetylglucosamine pyrophosphorylase/glucosamine-1-phosphate N-acetyltransferase
MKNTKTRALILAAGEGKRMDSPVNKVLHKILDKTIIEYVVESLEQKCIDRIGIVVGHHNHTKIKILLKNRVDYIIQDSQKGTGHAVLAAEQWLNQFSGSLMVVVGDAPFISKQIIRDLIDKQQIRNSAVFFLTTNFENPPPWGRVLRDKVKNVLGIVEDIDASIIQKQIKEVSSSHYCFNWERLIQSLHKIDNLNNLNEYYLPDVINQFSKTGHNIETITTRDTLLSFGINTKDDLKYAEEQMTKAKSHHD